MAAMVDDFSGDSYKFSFKSDGTDNPLGSTRTCEDVFGTSLAGFDVWNMDSPAEPKDRKGRKKSSENNEKHASSEKKEKRTNSEKKDRHRSKSSKKSKDEAKSKKPSKSPKSRDVLDTAPEFAPISMLSPTPEKHLKKPSTSNKRSHSSSSSSRDEFSRVDKIGELMSLIKREKGEEVPPSRAPPPPSPSQSSSSSKRTQVPHSSRQHPVSLDLKKKLLEGKLLTKSYLPKRQRPDVGAAGRARERRDDVKASLKTFLTDSDEIPIKLGGRSVYSAPAKSGRRTKVRPTRQTSEGKQSPGLLSVHLRGSREKRRGDSEHRSVASAPAGRSAFREKDITEKIASLRIAF